MLLTVFVQTTALAEMKEAAEGDKLVDKDGVVKWVVTEDEPRWCAERKDIDAINALATTWGNCEEARVKGHIRYEELAKQLEAPPPPKPFLSTTVGQWTIGVSFGAAIVGGAILGFNLKR